MKLQERFSRPKTVERSAVNTVYNHESEYENETTRG